MQPFFILGNISDATGETQFNANNFLKGWAQFSQVDTVVSVTKWLHRCHLIFAQAPNTLQFLPVKDAII